jgi:enamine deaminase RidA (YjgF/YER057c/UK114 family)
MASRHPAEAVNPGWERYGKLTYSPAVKAGRVLFMSGQAALDPPSEQALFAGDVVAQADYTYGNIVAVLQAAGLGPEDLVKTIEYVLPEALNDYRQVAKVRARRLSEPYPASTGLVIPKLLRPEFLIEIDPMALFP